MTESTFRQLALALPEALESAHMGHPDFRVRGKIFATLRSPGKGWAMVKLTPEQQDELVAAAPNIFKPVQGGWGRSGATNVKLVAATKGITREALALAWRNVAPRKLTLNF
jgi:hypothetical protein